jgi:hypothetical protein
VSDLLAARLRTAWPLLLGWLAAWLVTTAAPVVTWIRDVLGVEVTQAQISAGLGVLLAWLIWEAGRWLERRTGTSRLATAARIVGRLLLSLGLHTGQPVYGLPPARTQTAYEYDDIGRLRTARSTTTWPARE